MEKTFKAIKTANGISFRDAKELREFSDPIEIGTELVITISSKRSLDQNRLFHKLVTMVASEVGESFEATKVWLVCRFFGCNETEIEGNVYTVPVSTSKLNKREFAEGLTNLIIFAEQELGIVVPDSNSIINKLKSNKQDQNEIS